MVKYDEVENLRLFIKSGGIGVLLAMAACVSRILFTTKNQNRYIKAVGDIVFSIFACIVTFLFLLSANSGMFRAYAFIGECFGFLLFFLLPGYTVINTVLPIKRFACKKTGEIFSKLRTVIRLRKESMQKSKKKNKKVVKKSNKSIATK